MQDNKVYKIPEATQNGHVYLKEADLDDPDKNGVELYWTDENNIGQEKQVGHWKCIPGPWT
jgi:hypothetical protein